MVYLYAEREAWVVTGIGSVFTLANARAHGVRKDQVYDLVEAGEVERVGRGVYVRPGAIDPMFVSLAAASVVRPESTMCLISALAHHGLTDAIPFGTDIALSRGTRFPAGFEHVRWHSFDRATFGLGRETRLIAAAVEVGIYSAARCVIDAFRLRHQEGSEVAHEALRRWLARRGHSPSTLLDLAAYFPLAEPGLRRALEVLL